MLTKVLVSVVIIVAAFLGYVVMQPSDFRISREVKINTSAEIPFAKVNDLHKFDAWNPWSKLDPQAKQTFEGPTAGKGAVSSWEGNNEVGSGRMTITESQPNSLILMKLEMFKPFAATNNVEFSFKPEGAQTTVSWIITGQANFISKIFCVFINRDKMIGKEFEKGLEQLKLIAEGEKKK
jgi:uncharacterized protein YndB with AHSA1/START domain